MESSERRQNKDFRALAQGLASGNPTIRRASEQLLENCDGDVRRQVISRLIRDSKATKRWMLGIAWAVFVPHVLATITVRVNAERWWMSVGLASIGIVARFALMLGPLQRQIDALIRAVAPVQGPTGCVSLFLEALRCSDCYTVETCEALERSVAQVRSGEAGVVTRKQQQWLVQRVIYEWAAQSLCARWHGRRTRIHALRRRWCDSSRLSAAHRNESNWNNWRVRNPPWRNRDCCLSRLWRFSPVGKPA